MPDDAAHQAALQVAASVVVQRATMAQLAATLRAGAVAGAAHADRTLAALDALPGDGLSEKWRAAADRVRAETEALTERLPALVALADDLYPDDDGPEPSGRDTQERMAA